MADKTEEQKAEEAAKIAAEKKPEMKPEEIEALASDAIDALGFGKPSTAPPEKEKKPRSTEEKSDDDKDKEKEKEKEKKPTVSVTKKPTPPDTEAIATAAAKKALQQHREEGRDTAPPTPPPASAPEDIKLDAEDEKELQIAEYLTTVDADGYKNTAAEMRKFFKEVLLPYKSKWMKEHPGEKFDADSTEHEDIYARQPEIDPEDWDEAKIEYRADKKAKEVKKEMSSEFEKFKSQQAMEKHLPQIEARAVDAAIKLVEDVDPDLAKHLKSENPYQAMLDEDPVAAKIIDHGVHAMRNLVIELDKLSNPEIKYAFDGNNKIHKVLVEFADDYEKEIKARPAGQQEKDGKKFATQDEFNRMKPEERRGHWVISGADMRDVLIEGMTNSVKKNLEEARADMAASSSRERGAASKTTQEEHKTPPPRESYKPKPPTTSSSGDVINGEKTDNSGGKPLSESVVDVLFSR